MRKRRSEDRLTADETVALHSRVTGEASGLSTEAKREYVAAVLELHGTDIVNALRARRWIRRGRRPAEADWDT